MAPSTERPGRTMGIVAFILAFFVQLVALVLGIIALVQSRKAGQKNSFALAAIIISAVLMVLGVVVVIVVIATVGGAYADLCAQYGTGTHEISGQTVELVCN
ncbi:hypothetical protein FHX49_001600 [Microbacterium endophyticum]|uniref:DUF4190 domain-containing protein n=1 Tax=Microbacterium endophyticum TaxID=1526412 RepID=A0A7W4YM26_9MICO|nr:MptD family putative ECF transporter S component [Microbacterium endophyticum]MBB2976030.1 hypothetical protein [Microbacterium endophyticum]NIK35051.1 hypothetical protein [Microbacterium endophyticum]